MILLRQNNYSSSREKVPPEIAKKAKEEGVVQQDSSGHWRIVSLKTSPPEYWNAKYKTKDDAEKALSAYHAQKHFSTGSHEQNPPKDARALKTTGKIGLQVAGLTAAAGGVELGRSAYHATTLVPELKQLKNLRKNKYLRSSIKQRIKETLPGQADTIIEKTKWAESNFPKFSKVDKLQRGISLWNKTSQPSRTILNNAERYVGMGVEGVKKHAGSKMTAQEKAALDSLPRTARKLAKTGTALKNAKALGKAAAVVGQVGGLLYLNGRALENQVPQPVKSVKTFTELKPYYKTSERIKKASIDGLIGASVGAGMGGAIGSVGGKSGAILGATLGSILLGGVSAKSSWTVGTSNDIVDIENKTIMRIDKDPENTIFGFFKNKHWIAEVTKEVSKIEKTFRVTVPQDFYKLIEVNKKFIPELVSWYKKYNDLNRTAAWNMCVFFPSPSYSPTQKFTKEDSSGIQLFQGASRISWNPVSGNYISHTSGITGKSFKKVCLDILELKLRNTSGIDPEYKDLLQRYSKYLKAKL